MIHQLKILPEYFVAVTEGIKKFEVRQNDRNFKVGDFLALNEFDRMETGRCCLMEITYILDNADFCKQGQIIMSIKPCTITKCGEMDIRNDVIYQTEKAHIY